MTERIFTAGCFSPEWTSPTC